MLFTIFSLFSLQRFTDYGPSRKPLFHPYPLTCVTYFTKKLSAVTFLDRCHHISEKKATACAVNSIKISFAEFFLFILD